MTSFNPPELDNLKGKVVVLTGGVLGIGAELVRICHKAGAHVFFGDVLVEQGEALAASLRSQSTSTTTSNSNPPTQHAHFVRTDASNYQSNLDLFDAAFSACGRVDHAASVAGIGERGNIVDPALTLESVRMEPRESMTTLDVNFVGPLYFSRIASVYLRQGASDEGTVADKSLTLVSSVAGFTEAPGLYVYSATKHAVYGLMRSLRTVLIKSSPQPIRTNAVCPWMTETRMVSAIQNDWYEAGLPRNSPEDVARVIAGAMADTSLNGEALYVEGGRTWALEEGIDRTQPQWMGEKQSREFNIGQKVLGNGARWAK